MCEESVEGIANPAGISDVSTDQQIIVAFERLVYCVKRRYGSGRDIASCEGS